MDLQIENTLPKLHLLTGEERKTFEQALAVYVNGLIQNRFNQLVQLLYQLDVDEQQLRTLLTTYEKENAGSIIAELIIKRQLEKLESRKKQTPREDIPEEDRW
ncbi:MAG TPA: hypothetical protein VEY06_11800 [Flavisolibacter sp.]|jgi:hypothetical protein|nr:hypothetical protein [Flavisolibacter sp.]